MTHKLLLTVLLVFCFISCKSESTWEEFEDPIFITFLHEHYDVPITEKGRIDMDDETTREALADINHLPLHDIRCISLSGIKNLKNLSTLHCEYNRLSTLDVSGLQKLTQISCRNNNLKSLNVRGCINLWELYCGQNQLKELDLRGCDDLKMLFCSSQKDDKNNALKLMLIMSSKLQNKWEEGWAKWNPDVNVTFK